MNRRRVLVGAGAVILLAIAFGPRERFDEAWIEPTLPPDIDGWLARTEADVPGVRPGDGRGIVWARPETRERTPVSLVYLHGFSADRHEIEPALSRLAEEIGANLYFTRLTGHGRDGAAMAEATVEAWLSDAVEALVVGERIGERVVLVGTSTGGTLATWLAARPEGRSRTAALVLVSPNFHPRDHSSRILLYPWGTQIARAVLGPERCFRPENERQERHWTTCYPTSALATMMALVERVRTLDLSTVAAPTLVLYSPADGVVDPAETERAVRRMTGTTVTVNVVASTSDPAHHVLAGDIVSPASTDEVVSVVRMFLENQAVLVPRS
jgi:pimeloyl-ACP methyl ester carboxylesterase